MACRDRAQWVSAASKPGSASAFEGVASKWVTPPSSKPTQLRSPKPRAFELGAAGFDSRITRAVSISGQFSWLWPLGCAGGEFPKTMGAISRPRETSPRNEFSSLPCWERPSGMALSSVERTARASQTPKERNLFSPLLCPRISPSLVINST